jgi:hypothetical protein
MGYAVSAPAGYPGASYVDPGMRGDAVSVFTPFLEYSITLKAVFSIPI